MKIDSVLKSIKEILDRSLNQDYELYLFGSFARGTARAGSDIDIALKTEKEIDEGTFLRIKSQIDSLRTLRKIDFVYLNTASDELKKLVEKEGIRI